MSSCEHCQGLRTLGCQAKPKTVFKIRLSISIILNDEVTEIFKSLKILSDSLNTFFAGGLADDSLASASIDNANNISSKEILQTDK